MLLLLIFFNVILFAIVISLLHTIEQRMQNIPPDPIEWEKCYAHHQINILGDRKLHPCVASHQHPYN